jgi:hypothetical protein
MTDHKFVIEPHIRRLPDGREISVRGYVRGPTSIPAMRRKSQYVLRVDDEPHWSSAQVYVLDHANAKLHDAKADSWSWEFKVSVRKNERTVFARSHGATSISADMARAVGRALSAAAALADALPKPRKDPL